MWTISRTALMALVVAACSQPARQLAPRAVDAPVMTVGRVTTITTQSVAGTVRSRTTTTLAANIVGTVTRVRVSAGDRVRAGDVLVEIDAPEHRAGANRARAGAEQVERASEGAAAQARLAEATFQRIAALRARGSASAQEYDEASARRTAAQAEVARLAGSRGEARAALAQANAFVGYSSVRAPVDGVVTARLVDPGAQAAPGVPLVAIEEEDARRVDAYVPAGVEVRVGDDAIVDDRLPARVAHVQPSVDASARSALVELDLARPLRAGSYVKVTFPTGTRTAISVPAVAVVRRGALTSVFVVGADGFARMRLVAVGASDGATVEVLAGLEAGERLVTDPARVRDGVVVRSTT
jgi:RND family efflux transporter MFP subunit